jgi:thiol:disulfide interchange protein DsbD
MSLTFALTSFTCTVPFVGTVMVAALQGDFFWSLLGVTAFATVFSLPFFVLALFPSWLQSLPKSGNWMNSVKIIMGFLELAAALKFVSNVDLVYQWEFITRPVFITVWVAIGLVTALYLLGWFRFPHESPSESTGAFRVISAIFFFSVTFYLFRGLMGYSLGELDAFLPPRDYGAVADPISIARTYDPGNKEEWLTNFDEALVKAQEENRPIFLDFTGYTCTNCRWMEANIFTIPEVQQLFQQFILVRLYTDGTKPEHEANRKFEEERFNTIALPFYALISPEDETIATFPGLTRNPAEFIEFLEKAL